MPRLNVDLRRHYDNERGVFKGVNFRVVHFFLPSVPTLSARALRPRVRSPAEAFFVLRAAAGEDYFRCVLAPNSETITKLKTCARFHSVPVYLA